MILRRRTKEDPRGSADLGLPQGGVRRFALVERLAHWLYALLFVIALVSGLLMWIPASREWLAGARHAVALRHGITGFAMVIVPFLLLLILDRRRLRADLREVDRWSVNDRRWFWAALRGRSLRGKKMPPQGRLNAGQKASAILVAAMALGFAITGALLLGKVGLPAWLVSRALWLHDFLAVAAMALLAGHLGHVFLTRHGWGYLKGMFTGVIPEEIARERHVLWWQETTAGDGGSPVVDLEPEGLPAAGGRDSRNETGGMDSG